MWFLEQQNRLCPTPNSLIARSLSERVHSTCCSIKQNNCSAKILRSNTLLRCMKQVYNLFSCRLNECNFKTKIHELLKYFQVFPSHLDAMVCH